MSMLTLQNCEPVQLSLGSNVRSGFFVYLQYGKLDNSVAPQCLTAFKQPPDRWMQMRINVSTSVFYGLFMTAGFT